MKRALAFLALASALAAGLVIAGPLAPPAGPVASTYKTLAEVEPRIAVNAANTPGTAGSLYRITQSGSYYLTGPIIGVPLMDGIDIACDRVTLDLSGFSITGGYIGISAAAQVKSITVCNGVVSGCAS